MSDHTKFTIRDAGESIKETVFVVNMKERLNEKIT